MENKQYKRHMEKMLSTEFIIPNLPDSAVNYIRDQYLKLKNTHGVVDLLPWLRELSESDPSWQDHFFKGEERLYKIHWNFHNVFGLTIIAVNSIDKNDPVFQADDSDPEEWAPMEAEADFIILNLSFASAFTDPGMGFITPETEPALVLSILLSWLAYDCSGCCNALYYARMNEFGILSTGDISKTYHS